MVKEVYNKNINSNICEYDLLAGKLLALYIVFNITTNVLALLKFSTGVAIIVPWVAVAVFWIFLLYHQHIIGNKWKNIFLVETVFVCLYFVSAVWYNNFTTELFKRVFWTTAYCVPLGCIWYGVKDITGALRIIDKSTYYVVGISFFFLVASLLGFSTLSLKDYSMGLGYAILISLVYHLMMIKHKKIYLIFSIIEFVVILLRGSRAPILWALIFVLLVLFIRYKLSSKTGIKLSIMLGILCGTVLNFFKEILMSAVSLLHEFGIYSRTLTYLAEKPFFTGRDLQWKGAITHIQEKLVHGWGLGYDSITPMGMQPHNFMLEIVLQYGIIMGCVILMIVAMCIINAFAKSNDQDKETILLFFSISVLPLMLSSSYLVWPFFWILVGICLKIKFTVKSCI